MQLSHPVYGECVYVDVRNPGGRWRVRGGAFLSEIEDMIREGLTNEEIRGGVFTGGVEIQALEVIREKCGIVPRVRDGT